MADLLDMHHHLIFGLDYDGPKEPEDSFQMVEAAVEDGVTTIITTPHVMPGVQRFEIDKYLMNFDRVRAYCENYHPHLKLYTGAEIYYTSLTPELLRAGKIPTMADTRHVLVEFSTKISFDDLREALRQIVQAGYIPIIAHAERYECLVHLPKRIGKLRDELPLYVQINASLVNNKRGFWRNRFFNQLMKNDWLDFIASDAHNVRSRRVNLSEAVQLMSEQYPDFRQRNFFEL